jgi:hypothetical protein
MRRAIVLGCFPAGSVDDAQDLDTKGVVLRSEVQPLTTRAAALKHIHAFVRGTALDTVESAQQGFRAAPSQLLVKDAQTVVAFLADLTVEMGGVPEFAKRSGERMFQ